MSWPHRLKLVLFALIPLIGLVAVAQSCAYLTTHRTITTAVDSVTGLTYYSMRIGQWPWSHRSFTPLNSLDLPDDEFLGLRPKAQCVHVLLAGDSFTFGDATDRARRWATLIGQMTARRHPDRCVRFFNIGVRNSTIDTTRARIRQVLPLIEPDAVILGQYQNDLTDLTLPGSPAYVRPDPATRRDQHWAAQVARAVPLYNNALVRFLTYCAFGFMIRHDIPYDVLETWSVLEGESKRELAARLKGIYHDLYGELVGELRGQGIAVAALAFPSKMDLLAGRSPETEYFATLADEFDVPFLALLPTLDAHRARMPYYLYDGHLNEFGNRIVAAAVWHWLFMSPTAPIPALGAAE
jgi:hypothetical protein